VCHLRLGLLGGRRRLCGPASVGMGAAEAETGAQRIPKIPRRTQPNITMMTRPETLPKLMCWRNMKEHSIKLHLGVTLRDYHMRRTVAAVEHIIRAGEILAELHVPCLETVRDYCIEYTNSHKSTESKFQKAWIAMVIQHLNDARLRERRLYHAITGEDVQEGNGHYGVGGDESG
jgi:hypothetical protein